MRVACFGLGLMGEPIAEHLIRCGHEVVLVAHRSRGAIDRLVAKGASEAADGAAAVAATEVALLLLPSSKEVEAVLFGARGAGAAMPAGYVVVDMGTCYPLDTRRLAARVENIGGRFLDAPVTNGVEGARSATLTVMVGGDREVLSFVRPLLEAFSREIHHFGAVGAGHTAKLVQNMIGWIEVAGIAEGLALARATDLDLKTFFKMLSASHSNSPIVQWMIPKVFAGAFDDVEFRLDLAHKDIRQAAAMGREMTSLPLPVANAAVESFQLARSLGFGAQDSTAVIRALETLLGETVRADLTS